MYILEAGLYTRWKNAAEPEGKLYSCYRVQHQTHTLFKNPTPLTRKMNKFLFCCVTSLMF